jgi:hypothetical protein
VTEGRGSAFGELNGESPQARWRLALVAFGGSRTLDADSMPADGTLHDDGVNGHAVGHRDHEGLDLSEPRPPHHRPAAMG